MKNLSNFGQIRVGKENERREGKNHGDFVLACIIKRRQESKQRKATKVPFSVGKETTRI